MSKKLWRDSASMLILGRNANTDWDGCNYKLLAIKRSSKSSFLPDTTVFPGGVLEQSDTSSDWLDYYHKAGISDEQLNKFANVEGVRPSIFTRNLNEALPREISLRICAIREAFEEVGLLFCRYINEIHNENIYSKVITRFDVKYWQKEVHNDSSKFICLCKSLNVIPDLWSLYEWSVWLTPKIIPKRFQTVFFLTALKDQPKLMIEKDEVGRGSWISPKTSMNLYKLKKISFTGPQLYEICRIINLNDISRIVHFAKKRNNQGSDLYYPIGFQTNDGVVYVLPGDDFYPEHVDYEQDEALTLYEESMDDFRRRATNFNRTEYDKGEFQLNVNIEPMYGHIRMRQKKLKSKL